MLQTVGTITGVAILLALLWAAREALMLVYVSALIAMGLSPLVRLIERPKRQGKRRVPRLRSRLAVRDPPAAAIARLREVETAPRVG